MASIVCDSDFLIKISNDPLPKFPFVELSKEYEFLIIPSVLHEINGLEKSSIARTARRARRARRIVEETKLFEQYNFQIASGSEPVKSVRETDDALIEFVRKNPRERILATMDGSLLSKMNKLGLPYLTLRNEQALFSRK